MVTDRCTTSCLLCFLSSAYPQYTWIFQALISVDLASHYMHMYSTLSQGVVSHKKIPREQSWVLRSYYGNNVITKSALLITTDCPVYSLRSKRTIFCIPLSLILPTTTKLTTKLGLSIFDTTLISLCVGSTNISSMFGQANY
jgi:phosphatidylglycerophosphate synthase